MGDSAHKVFIDTMDDKNSLIGSKSGFSFNFKTVRKHSNLILPAIGFLVFLICLLFIFSILAEGGSDDGEWDCGTGWAACWRGETLLLFTPKRKMILSKLYKKKTLFGLVAGSEKDGEFSWIDGSEWNYDSWDEREPDRKNYGKDHHECTFLSIENQQGRGHRGYWWDGVCNWRSGGFDCLCKK